MRLLVTLVVLASGACATAPAPVAAPEPCPDPPALECPKPTTRVVRVAAECEPCPECEPCEPPAPALPPKTAPLTCVLGQVKTAGELRMVVQRALVVLWHGDQVLAKTWTDDLGAFVACVESAALAEPLDVAIEISKDPFNPVMIKTRLTRGQHRNFQVGFEAEGLTD